MAISNRSGSALIECVIVIGAFVAVLITSRSQPFSLGFSRLWVEYQTYEYLRCEMRAGQNCESNLKRQARVLSWGHVRQIETKKVTGANHRWSISTSVNWCNDFKEHPCPKYKTLVVSQRLDEKELAALP